MEGALVFQAEVSASNRGNHPDHSFLFLLRKLFIFNTFEIHFETAGLFFPISREVFYLHMTNISTNKQIFVSHLSIEKYE